MLDSVARSEIRAFEARDCRAVALLHAEVVPRHKDAISRLEEYYKTVFLDNPWSNPEIRSLVYEKNGRACGFVGLVPRPARLCGGSITTAVLTHIMVHPSCRRSGIGQKMTSAALSCPQDFTIADEANDPCRSVWERCGGRTARLQSLNWNIILNPASYLIHKRFGDASKIHSRLLAVTAALLDPLILKVTGMRNRSINHLKSQPFDPVRHIDDRATLLRDTEYRVLYTLDSFNWTLKMLQMNKRRGELVSRLVRSPDDRLLGWFHYFAKPRATAEIIDVVSAKQNFPLVLDCLIEDARNRKCAVVAGRLDPRVLSDLTNRGCFFVCDHWMLVASKSNDTLAAISSETCFFSRFDGEWPLMFPHSSQ